MSHLCLFYALGCRKSARTKCSKHENPESRFGVFFKTHVSGANMDELVGSYICGVWFISCHHMTLEVGPKDMRRGVNTEWGHWKSSEPTRNRLYRLYLWWNWTKMKMLGKIKKWRDQIWDNVPVLEVLACEKRKLSDIRLPIPVWQRVADVDTIRNVQRRATTWAWRKLDKNCENFIPTRRSWNALPNSRKRQFTTQWTHAILKATVRFLHVQGIWE